MRKTIMVVTETLVFSLYTPERPKTQELINLHRRHTDACSHIHAHRLYNHPGFPAGPRAEQASS